MIFLSKLQVNVARFRKVLLCVEISYTDFKDSKSKYEEILAMLKIVLPHGITNLSEKKMNKFNSHPTDKKSEIFKYGCIMSSILLHLFSTMNGINLSYG